MKNKRIFFVTSDFPGKTSGAPVRNYNLIRGLSKKGYNLELFTIVDKEDSQKIENLEKELGIKVHFVIDKKLDILRKFFYLIIKKEIPYLTKAEKSGISLRLAEKIEENSPEIIQFETINSYFACRKIISLIKDKKIKIVLDEHNLEFNLFKQAIKNFSPIKKIIGKYVLNSLKYFEIDAIKSSDIVLCCSNEDKIKFEGYLPSKKIFSIPNGADIDYFKSSNLSKEKSILFMARFGYPPNDDAIKFYIDKIHKKIKKEIKGFKIYILGKNPPKWLFNLSRQDESIILMGFVKDVRNYLEKARVCICPLRSGSGTRLKILEYLACGKPVVSTSIGAEGIEVTNKKNIILEDNPNKFAEKVIKLLNEEELSKKLGKNGRKLVEERYSWDKIVVQMEKGYSEILSNSNETIKTKEQTKTIK
jgi:polysaccharide biosynthesis protein PslH